MAYLLQFLGVQEDTTHLAGLRSETLKAMYDLFREFSQPTLKHRALFCCLSS